MVNENITLAGLPVHDNKKWYCNSVVGEIAKCCDSYNEKGIHIERIGRYKLTGEEDWKFNSVSKCYYFNADNKYYDEIDGGKLDPMLCTHFRWCNDIENTPLYMFSGGTQNEIQFNYDNGVGGLTNFVEWIKSQAEKKTPVEVYYVLLYPFFHEANSHKRTNVFTMKRLLEASKCFQ